jgi:hypothetical protein
VGYPDKLLALLDLWEMERGTMLPCPSGRSARAVVHWIRTAIEEVDNGRLEAAQLRMTELGHRLGRAERELRDTAREMDRWRKRAHEAEALVKSLGVQAQQN